jgi:phage tail protein X
MHQYIAIDWLVRAQYNYLRRLIQHVLRANVLALINGQLTVLFSSVVRLPDPFFVATASAASASATTTIVSASMRL